MRVAGKGRFWRSGFYCYTCDAWFGSKTPHKRRYPNHDIVSAKEVMKREMGRDEEWK